MLGPRTHRRQFVFYPYRSKFLDGGVLPDNLSGAARAAVNFLPTLSVSSLSDLPLFYSSKGLGDCLIGQLVSAFRTVTLMLYFSP